FACYVAGGEYKGDGSGCSPNPCLCADFFVNAPGSWTGTTCGAGNDCGLRNTEEVIYAVTIPWDGTWIFDLCGSTFDTYMFVGTSCCGAELGYNDDYCNYQSQMTFTELAAGTYYMDIEGYSGCGSYVFNVHEVLGACCVNEVCVGDLKPAACYAQGGQWWSGMSCASFACPHWGCPESEITVTYVPDSQPYETSWQVVQEGTGATICTNPPMTTAFATYVTDCCVRSADCYDWNCQDAYGDGTYAPGGYEILFDGVVVAWTLGSGWYGSSVSVTQIGGCVFPGACCFWGDPFCAVMFEADCYGAWLGPWTDCGVLADCDDDYISDGCTIGMGLGLDCNGNGIPDSCDITDCHLLPPDERWWCQDCQPDGIPDGCQLAGGGSGPGLLYAPTEDDNPAFRAAVSAMIGVPVDYFDARSGTPTLTQMQGYAAVMTWVDYAYADDVTFGNNLADYVDGGGIVILGQWCALPAGEGFLGRIMWDAGYNPATATSWGASSYAGDGVACVHGGVTSYASDYRDNISLMPGAISDGTWLDGIPAIAYWPDYSPRVFYSPGNTGGSYSSGDWALLTANMITCVLGHQPHDCNGNLIPDECDIAQCDGSRWCRDCDHDGYPDGCECVSMGDLDNSGAVDGLDIQVFIDCALGSGDNCVCGDFDCNGRVGPGDLSEFVGALLAP
ncbi:MAG TPA: hypothetical protein VMV94_05390, partial [Phycisphaerae bacterium]|nr:hypothetical protein [Phycisphaerae bacterium]